MKPALMQGEKPSFFQTYRLPAVIGASSALAGAGYALHGSDHFAPGLMCAGATAVTALLAKKLWDVFKQEGNFNWEKSYRPLYVGALGSLGLGFVLAKIVQNRGWNPYILAAIAGVGAGSFCNFKVRQMLDIGATRCASEVNLEEDRVNSIVDNNQESVKLLGNGLLELTGDIGLKIKFLQQQGLIENGIYELTDRELNVKFNQIIQPEKFAKIQKEHEEQKKAFIETMPDDTEENSLVVAFWRKEALKNLESVLDDEQKKMLARAYKIDLIKQIINAPDKVQKHDVVPESLKLWIIWASDFYKTVFADEQQNWLQMIKKDIQEKRDYWLGTAKGGDYLNGQNQDVQDVLNFLSQMQDISVFNNVLESLSSYGVHDFVNAIRATDAFKQWSLAQGIA